MTVEQQEQHILTLIYKLPLVHRIRLAWTIIQGVQPEQIQVEEATMPAPPFIPMTDEEWKTEINNRAEEIESGKVKVIPIKDVMAKAKDITSQ